MAWLKRFRARLAQTNTGNSVIDACCHRLGGEWRAGPRKKEEA